MQIINVFILMFLIIVTYLYVKCISDNCLTICHNVTYLDFSNNYLFSALR